MHRKPQKTKRNSDKVDKCGVLNKYIFQEELMMSGASVIEITGSKRQNRRCLSLVCIAVVCISIRHSSDQGLPLLQAAIFTGIPVNVFVKTLPYSC